MGKINMAVKAAMLCLALTALTHARDALFLGFTDINGEPANQRLEQALRVELSTSQKFRLIGDLETQRVIREIDRLGRRRTEPFMPPSARVADSVVVIRGIVEENRMEVKRRWLGWSKIDASMTVKLLLSEAAGPTAYQGKFSAAATKKKEFVLFGNEKKIVHISAVDRSELLSEMQAKIVKEASEFTAQWIGALASGPVHKKEAAVDSVTVPEEQEDGFPGAEELMTEESTE